VSANRERVHLQYQDFETQTHAARLGMWLVVISEVLLFSGLFTLYASYRAAHPHAFAAAARHTSLWLGTTMTYLLITSSLFVALGVRAVRVGGPGRSERWLGLAIAAGVTFLAMKGYEYAQHLREGIAPGVYYTFEGLPGAGASAFFTLYYLTTGLHAVHVLVGLLVLSVAVWGVRTGRFDEAYATPVELGGMYWHLVDAIWLFLWPMFYLMR
jgi:cytochrome c oxidase subunit 3